MAKPTLTITFDPIDRERIERFRKTVGGGMSSSALIRLVMRNWLNDVEKRSKEFSEMLSVTSKEFISALSPTKHGDTIKTIDAASAMDAGTQQLMDN
jgi:hypothetical protein